MKTSLRFQGLSDTINYMLKAAELFNSWWEDFWSKQLRAQALPDRPVITAGATSENTTLRN